MFLQFNKLQHVGDVPDWIVCKVDGNDNLQLKEEHGEEQTGIGMEDNFLDWEPTEDVEYANGTDGKGLLFVIL